MYYCYFKPYFLSDLIFLPFFFSFLLCFDDFVLYYTYILFCGLLWIFCMFLIYGHLFFKNINSFLYLFPLDWSSYRLKHMLGNETLFLHILWFWCPLLHLHVHPFALYCGYPQLHKNIYSVTCVLAYLGDLLSNPIDSFFFFFLFRVDLSIFPFR